MDGVLLLRFFLKWSNFGEHEKNTKEPSIVSELLNWLLTPGRQWRGTLAN